MFNIIDKFNIFQIFKKKVFIKVHDLMSVIILGCFIERKKAYFISVIIDNGYRSYKCLEKAICSFSINS